MDEMSETQHSARPERPAEPVALPSPVMHFVELKQARYSTVIKLTPQQAGKWGKRFKEIETAVGGRAEILGYLERYVADTDPWLAEKKHPADLFVNQYDRWAPASPAAAVRDEQVETYRALRGPRDSYETACEKLRELVEKTRWWGEVGGRQQEFAVACSKAWMYLEIDYAEWGEGPYGETRG